MTPAVMTNFLAYNRNLDTTNFISQLTSPPPFDLVRQSFMHELAREGDLLSAEVLFDAGSAIDLPNDEGRRPLHEAAFFGHIDMLRFLVANGAAVDAPIPPFGHTALYLAVQQGRHDVVKYLIEADASLNAEDSFLGTGLLHIAAAKDDALMAGILIAAGIGVFHEDRQGRTARDIAARHGHTGLAKTLLKVMEHRAKFCG